VLLLEGGPPSRGALGRRTRHPARPFGPPYAGTGPDRKPGPQIASHLARRGRIALAWGRRREISGPPLAAKADTQRPTAAIEIRTAAPEEPPPCRTACFLAFSLSHHPHPRRAPAPGAVALAVRIDCEERSTGHRLRCPGSGPPPQRSPTSRWPRPRPRRPPRLARRPPSPSRRATRPGPTKEPAPEEKAMRGVVVIERAGQPLALGGVLSGDGRILTALSPLGSGNDLDARYADGTAVRVKLGHHDRPGISRSSSRRAASGPRASSPPRARLSAPTRPSAPSRW
jgi:hypothetical protein